IAAGAERLLTLPASRFDAERRQGHVAALGRYHEAGDDDAILLTADDPVPFLQEQVLIALVVDLQLIDLGLILLADFHDAVFEPLIERDELAVVLLVGV